MIHLYIGDGKGKTTAAMGLAVRAAGRRKKVIVAQFLKTRTTGEIISLEKLYIPIVRSQKKLKFIFNMNDEEKEICREEQNSIIVCIKDYINKNGVELLVLDEIIDALNTGMISEEDLRGLLESAAGAEYILTGRNPPQWLIERADYISETKKIKHPFDLGIQAREGIEF